jgi:hypothetical protein
MIPLDQMQKAGERRAQECLGVWLRRRHPAVGEESAILKLAHFMVNHEPRFSRL